MIDSENATIVCTLHSTPTQVKKDTDTVGKLHTPRTGRFEKNAATRLMRSNAQATMIVDIWQIRIHLKNF